MLFFKNQEKKWKERINLVIGKEKISMDSVNGWKQKTAEQYFLEEDLREEKDYQLVTNKPINIEKVFKNGGEACIASEIKINEIPSLDWVKPI